MNNEILKTQTAALLYPSFSYCTELYTEYKLDRQLHLS